MRSADGRFEYRDQNDEPVMPGTSPAQVHRFAFICRSCKKVRPETTEMCSLNLGGRGHDRPNKNWQWDGNVDKPTLTPSINCDECWHGYIRAGVFKTCGDLPEPMQ